MHHLRLFLLLLSLDVYDSAASLAGAHEPSVSTAAIGVVLDWNVIDVYAGKGWALTGLRAAEVIETRWGCAAAAVGVAVFMSSC